MKPYINTCTQQAVCQNKCGRPTNCVGYEIQSLKQPEGWKEELPRKWGTEAEKAANETINNYCAAYTILMTIPHDGVERQVGTKLAERKI